MASADVTRCGWVTNDELYQRYHDTEWGRPERDDQALFAKLCLDGQQAGLSWITILKKQQNYEAAFYNFDPHKIVAMPNSKRTLLMQNSGIIRNRLKVDAIFANAVAYLKIAESQSFSEYIWQFTDGRTVTNAWQDHSQVPVSSPASRAMAKALKKAGFKFVGETICYAFMQAVGMVNDHTVHCHCYEEVCELAVR